MNLSIPYISIKPGYITFFAIPAEPRIKPILSDEAKANLKKNSPAGRISFKARRRVSTAIDWMLYFSNDKKFYSPKHRKSFNFRLNFLTLTLASKQMHSDQVIKNKLLNQFLIELKRDFNVKHYIWRSEAQKNGNIHFHIVTDKFIPWSTIRKSWNRIQSKLGYVDGYRKEMHKQHAEGFTPNPGLYKTWSLDAQKRAYKSGLRGNWSNPNSTDVHSIYKIRNLSSYLSKYFTKEDKYVVKPTGDQRTYEVHTKDERNLFTVECVELVPLFRPIDGKLWGLSHSLSKLQGVVLEISVRINDELTRLYGKFRNDFKFHDYYTVFYCNFKKWMSFDCPAILKSFQERLFEMVNSEKTNSLNISLFTNPDPPDPVTPQLIPVQGSFDFNPYI